MMSKYLTIFLLCVSFTRPARAQTSGMLEDIVSAIDTFSTELSQEKLYLHLDKPYYSIGHTIWFKAYLFNSSLLTASKKSGLCYIEIANDTNKVLLRRMVTFKHGVGSGNISLPGDIIHEGSYTIRAYTNLMRNFGEDRVFKKHFYVAGLGGQEWLASAFTSAGDSAGKSNLRMGLRLKQLDNQVVGLKNLGIRVLNGKKTILKDKVQTDSQGGIDVNFNIPDGSEGLTFIAENAEKGGMQKVVIPIHPGRPENIDLQFMPEGGMLVAGAPSRVGFKAVGEDGQGVDLAGKIFSGSSQVPVAELKSLYKGMGSFFLNPQLGEQYRAVIDLPNGKTRTYDLPQAKSAGSILSMRNSIKNDSLEVSVFIAPDLSSNGQEFYLIGQCGAMVCYARTFKGSARIRVDKQLFFNGIARFTLLNSQRKAVNERLVFIDHGDRLNIAVHTEKSVYAAHDSIALRLEVKDKDGRPVRGSFSISVTDDGQVKSDTTSNILTNLLLTADLKGTVEDPASYFTGTEASWQSLDNLLLTQGWVSYVQSDTKSMQDNWLQGGKESHKTSEFQAEKELMITGKVVNVLNKPLGSTKVAMISTRPLFVKDTVTNKSGAFEFSGFPAVDSLVVRLQATNKRDKSFNVEIVADEFKPPVFNAEAYQTDPWYVNTDSSLLKYVSNTIIQKQEEFKFSGKDNVLNTVNITVKKIVKGSKNLNGEGGADLTIDEADLKREGKKSLLQLLQERIPKWMVRYGVASVFTASSNTSTGKYERYYAINGSKANFIIDGMELDYNYLPIGAVFDEYFTYITRYLEYFSAEDVKGIEFMKPGKYTALYTTVFKHPAQKPGITIQTINGRTVVTDSGAPLVIDTSQPFIEITTRSGQGPWSMPTPGTYLFKAMPFVGTKEFYRPKYEPKGKPPLLPDLRSTVHWEPNIITNSEGRGVLSFYSSDRPGTYSVVAEGADMAGNIGFGTANITVIK